MKYNENYYMYYTAESDNEEMNLCIAISDDPEGPWVKQGSISNIVNNGGGVVELNGILLNGIDLFVFNLIYLSLLLIPGGVIVGVIGGVIGGLIVGL